MIKLYHGSDTFIEVPDLNRCKPFKDFGKGFYLSADRKQAELLAVQRCRQTLKDIPVVNEFLFDDFAMTSGELNVLCFKDYSEDWVRFVLANRDMYATHSIHDYDIVFGPIADDSVTFQLRRFQRGVIRTIDELIAELRYEKGITFQYYFGTQRALNKLVKL